MFQAAGHVSGSDGCNRISGSYQLKGDAVTFGQIVGTQMACIDVGETERAFRAALKDAVRLTRTDDRMELADAGGRRLAVFMAGAQTSASSRPDKLEGTSSRLVKFQESDGRTDGGIYELEPHVSTSPGSRGL